MVLRACAWIDRITRIVAVAAMSLFLALTSVSMCGVFAATTGIVGAVESVVGMMAILPMDRDEIQARLADKLITTATALARLPGTGALTAHNPRHICQGAHQGLVWVLNPVERHDDQSPQRADRRHGAGTVAECAGAIGRGARHEALAISVMVLQGNAPRRVTAAWLYGCAAMVFAMVVLGGLTRLTGSGLSMVDWQPVAGILPPMDAAAWQALFDQYKTSPEFRRVNFWMTVDDFRSIFWLEFLHRLWGRLIGLVFGLPLVYFLIRGWIGWALGLRLVVLFVLGGAQGLLGWYMVKSGLVDRPDVSQYRLAAHLMLAVALYGYLLWTALGIGARRARRPQYRFHLGLVITAIALTMTWGALVAGLDAGHIYPTFPLMDGRVVPAEILTISPWPADLTENAATVQFLHRVLAITLVVLVLALWWRGRGAEYRRTRSLDWLAAVALIQAGLGVATLLAGVPAVLAVAHQAGGLVLLSIAVHANHVWQRA